jgi:hypothetical protein
MFTTELLKTTLFNADKSCLCLFTKQVEPWYNNLYKVKEKRKQAIPNSGFEKQLREYSYSIHDRF